jgi:leucyl aminopeptidase
MNIIAKKGKLSEEKSDLLVFGVFADFKINSGLLGQADKALDGLIAKLAQGENFTGKFGEQLVLHTHGKLTAARILLIGLGEKKLFNAETIRRAAGLVVKYGRETGVRKICSPIAWNSLNATESTQALCEGAFLADYQYLVFKPVEAKRLKKRGLVTWTLLDEETNIVRAAEKGIAQGEISSRATVYARDLVNEPGSRMTPEKLKEHAEKIAANDRRIKLKVFDRAACEKMGMNAFLAVAKGSEEAPYFLHLTYSPVKAKRKLVIVGKGVTFDSGGLSLKPTSVMVTMKSDMAGAAAVLGLFSVLSDIEPSVEIHGLVAACENMPSGRAMRVDDIVTAMNGKSIEITHTDAEGRLTLADALSYAVKKIKPDGIFDLATLTGSCEAALGTDVAGLFSNDDKLMKQIQNAAAAANEPMCQLPLHEDYLYLMKADHADLRNSDPGRWGDAITASLFLKEFVGETPWAHLDFGGPAFSNKNNISYIPKGGTGYGVRTLIKWVKAF